MARDFDTISSPYNFVPLAETIVYPGAEGDTTLHAPVTQDIPFRDGLDGELQVTITAETPIYIRDGAADDTRGAAGDRTTEFFQLRNGQYTIPATSLKGAVRNVLEIAGFGKMQQISDRRYSLRDLRLRKYTSQFSDQSNWQPLVKAGWLDISSDDWTIPPCDFARIERSRIGENFGNRRMSAADKYRDFIRRYSAEALTQKVTIIPNSERLGKEAADKPGMHYDEVIKLGEGNVKGSLVFTGQPTDYMPGKRGRKHREFVFHSERPRERFLVDESDTIYEDEYGDEVRPKQRDFRFIHEEQSNAQDWQSWTKRDGLKQHFNGRIPIFYLCDGTGKLRSFGLAMLFRLAGAKTMGEFARNSNSGHFPLRGEASRPDLAELIFGYVRGNEALRGRVHFSHCRASAPVQPEPMVTCVLGSPKPSFYPSYFVQGALRNNEDYKTILDADAKLKGWKRYPVLNPLVKDPSSWGGATLERGRQEEAAENMQTRFQPLPAGTVFTGKIRYHNLRPVELGALLWSLCIGNSKYHRHMIGMAKPYGFGVVKIEVTRSDNGDINADMKAFADYMSERLQQDWKETPQIKALTEMSKYVNVETDWNFRYLSLAAHQQVKGSKRDATAPLQLGEYTTRTKSSQQPQKAGPAPAIPADKLSPMQQFINDSTKMPPSKKDFLNRATKLLEDATPQEAAELLAIARKRKDLGNKYDPQISKFFAACEKKLKDKA